MNQYDCTCPVCMTAHDVEASFLSSPRTITATNGRPGLALSCGNHSAADLRAAFKGEEPK